MWYYVKFFMRKADEEKMDSIRKFYLSGRFCFGAVFSASPIRLIIYGLTVVICAVLPIVELWLFNIILSSLAAGELLGMVLPKILIFAACLIFIFISGLIKERMYFFIESEVSFSQEDKFHEILAKIPLSQLDSANGKDTIGFAKDFVFSSLAYVEIFIEIISLIISAVIAISSMARFSLIYTLILALFAVPGVMYSFIVGKAQDAFERKYASDERRPYYYRWMLTDSAPAKDVKVYDLTDDIKKRYFDETANLFHLQTKLNVPVTFVQMSLRILKDAGAVGFFVILVINAYKGNITVGELTMYSGLALTMQSALVDTSISVSNLLFFARKYDDYEKIKSLIPDENKDSDGQSIAEFESLRFENVWFKYPYTENYVLKGLSFEIKKSEKVMIAGANSVGKTTIIKILIGAYNIEKGDIYINGRSITEYSDCDVKKLFSVMFQDFQLYPFTVKENVVISNLDDMSDTDAKCAAALEEAGIGELSGCMNQMLTRMFDDSGLEVSGGQRQKLVLARAYYKNAPVMILDEPSAALDPMAENLIFDQVYKNTALSSAVMISHRLSNTILADKIFVVEDGKISEEGNHDDLIKLSGEYSHLFNLQAKRYM